MAANEEQLARAINSKAKLSEKKFKSNWEYECSFRFIAIKVRLRINKSLFMLYSYDYKLD